MTTVDALKRLYVALGGTADDFKAVTNPDALKMIYEISGGNPVDVLNLNTNPEVIDALAFLKEGGITVAPMEAATELWGYTISQLQTSIAVSADNKITGTLSKIDSGSLADVWGEGYFIALTFTPNASAKSVYVAILPSEGAGWQKLDEDLACVFKVTNKATQKIYCKAIDGESTITQEYDLSGLTLGSG